MGLLNSLSQNVSSFIKSFNHNLKKASSVRKSRSWKIRLSIKLNRLLETHDIDLRSPFTEANTRAVEMGLVFFSCSHATQTEWLWITLVALLTDIFFSISEV